MLLSDIVYILFEQLQFYCNYKLCRKTYKVSVLHMAKLSKTRFNWKTWEVSDLKSKIMIAKNRKVDKKGNITSAEVHTSILCSLLYLFVF